MKKTLLGKGMVAVTATLVVLSVVSFTGCGASSDSAVSDDIAALEKAVDEGYAKEMWTPITEAEEVRRRLPHQSIWRKSLRR